MDMQGKERDFWTQEEVAEHFRVAPSTIHNWRKKGLLSFFQVPSSSRVLYLQDDVLKFKERYTTLAKAGKEEKKYTPVKGKPVVSATSNKEWRI